MTVRPTDARPTIAGAIDAGSTVARSTLDAGPPAEQAHLLLDMRGWCDVTIDSTPHGRAQKGHAIDLPPGRHQITCAQTSSDRSFHATVSLSPGETLTLTGTPLAPVDVTLAIDARIDRSRHPDGAKLQLPPGTYFVEALAGGKVTARAYVTVPTTGCTLKSTPELACY